MKKQILYALAVVLIFAACSKKMLREDEIIQKRDVLESAQPNLLLSSVIQKSAYTYYGLGGVNSTLLSVTMQYMQGNRGAGDNIYQGFQNPKGDLYSLTSQIKLVQAAIGIVHDKKLKVYEGIFTIFKSLLWSATTDLYGDIYYTEGLRGQDGILFPKFDDQKDIYPALILDLKNAVQLMTEGTETIDNTYDLFYAGDKTKWIKLANSLRLRLLMRVVTKLPSAPSDIAALAASPLISDTPENASIPFQGGDRTYSWPMGALYMGYTDNFLLNRPSKTLIDSLKALNDERLKVWAAPVERPWTNVKADNGKKETIVQKGYSYDVTWEYLDRTNAQIRNVYPLIQDSLTYFAGYPAGTYINALASNGSWQFPDTKWNYKISIFSKLLNENANPLLRAVIIQADEVQFLLAEAAVKGYISGSPENYYKAGVTMALKRWGETIPANYFSSKAAAFPVNGTNNQKLAKIALQKWLGLFMMGVESYVDFRRTRLPAMEANGELPMSAVKFPLRYRYPETEMSNNAINYKAAISKLDQGDTEKSKMWLVQ